MTLSQSFLWSRVDVEAGGATGALVRAGTTVASVGEQKPAKGSLAVFTTWPGHGGQARLKQHRQRTLSPLPARAAVARTDPPAPTRVARLRPLQH